MRVRFAARWLMMLKNLERWRLGRPIQLQYNNPLMLSYIKSYVIKCGGQ